MVFLLFHTFSIAKLQIIEPGVYEIKSKCLTACVMTLKLIEAKGKMANNNLRTSLCITLDEAIQIM